MPVKDHCQCCGVTADEAADCFGHPLTVSAKTGQKLCWECLEVNDLETWEREGGQR